MAEILRLSHIKDLPAPILHEVDTRTRRKILDLFFPQHLEITCLAFHSKKRPVGQSSHLEGTKNHPMSHFPYSRLPDPVALRFKAFLKMRKKHFQDELATH